MSAAVAPADSALKRPRDDGGRDPHRRPPPPPPPGARPGLPPPPPPPRGGPGAPPPARAPPPPSLAIPRRRGEQLVRLKNDFVAACPFLNALPAPPTALKLLKEGSNLAELSARALAPGLEGAHRWELAAEGTLGLKLDCVLDLAAAGGAGPYRLRADLLGAAGREARGDAARLLASAHLHPDDAALLGPVPGIDSAAASVGKKPIALGGGAAASGRKSGGGLGELHVPWLRRHVYLGNDLYGESAKTKQANDQAAADFARRAAEPADGVGAGAGGGVVSAHVEAVSLAAQVERIDQSFEAVAARCDGAEGPVHPLNPALRAVRVSPLLPDDLCWANTYTHVRFDGDPDPASDPHHAAAGGECATAQSAERRAAQLQRALAKGFALPNGGGTFLAYLLPADAKTAQHKQPDDAVPYSWVREYRHDVKPTAAGDAYLLCLGADGSASYNELSARIELTRRSVADRVHSGLNALRPSEVALRTRGHSETEAQQRAQRSHVVAGGSRELLEMRPPAEAQ